MGVSGLVKELEPAVAMLKAPFSLQQSFSFHDIIGKPCTRALVSTPQKVLTGNQTKQLRIYTERSMHMTMQTFKADGLQYCSGWANVLHGSLLCIAHVSLCSHIHVHVQHWATVSPLDFECVAQAPVLVCWYDAQWSACMLLHNVFWIWILKHPASHSCTSDNRSADAPLTFTGCASALGSPNAVQDFPVLSAGYKLTNYTQRSDGNYIVYVPDELKGTNITQLFVNGQREPLARKPNNGYLVSTWILSGNTGLKDKKKTLWNGMRLNWKLRTLKYKM